MITTQTRKFLCRLCGYKYEEELLCQIPLTVWLAHIKSLRCPQCDAGWRRLSFDIGAEQAEIEAREAERKTEETP